MSFTFVNTKLSQSCVHDRKAFCISEQFYAIQPSILSYKLLNQPGLNINKYKQKATNYEKSSDEYRMTNRVFVLTTEVRTKSMHPWSLVCVPIVEISEGDCQDTSQLL
jgi:hypothetical protein